MNTQLQKGISMPIIIGIVTVALIAVGAVIFLGGQQQEASPGETPDMSEGEAMIQEMMEKAYDYSGSLQDVTNGATVRGINTGGNSSGTAQATFASGSYMLLATFENLPDPQGTDFYEGWIVRRGAALDVISTGRVEKNRGVYTNVYSANRDLTDHDFYVLTLEPDDGDPAPADHIVEGTLTKRSHSGMEGIEGIHIMADGTVMLGNGEALEDATVTQDGKIQLGSGEVIEPTMDMREGGSMEDMMMGDDTMMEEGMMMEHETKIFKVIGRNFSFSQNEIRVKQGDTVRINFESADGFHDWVVDEFSAATSRVNTGGKTFVEFVASQKGTFEYYCSVGQHRQLGMVGNLIVE